ncbi:MAG: glutaminyl-peptide cyclotransferase [Streptosporangiaceae bacterium]
MRTWRTGVIRRVAHPGRGFTQGLIADDGMVWESTGLYGESALSRYQLGAREVEQRAPLAAELFGEGICRFDDVIWQLTWQDRIALRWDARTLELIDQVPYNREGWGICAADGYVVTSDGSSELVRREPWTLDPQEVIQVRCAGRRVLGLNDLAWSAGTIWANVAGTHYLAGIDPDSGEVTDIVNARAAAERHLSQPQAIMNGIAALPAPGEFLLTGKGWRSIRHVRLKPAREGDSRRRLLSGLSR